MTSSVVTQCLDKLFALCGTPSFVQTDNAAAFASTEFKTYLMKRGIVSSKSSTYHPAGNGQAERTVGTVWRSVQLALKTCQLPISHYETVLDNVLHSIRSLLCVAIQIVLPMNVFFNFQRRSCSGKSLPTRLSCLGKAFVRRFVRNSKSEILVDEVELINVNPTCADVRYQSGREAIVSIRDLAPCPQPAINEVDVVHVQPSVIDHEINVNLTRNVETDVVETSKESDVSINADSNEKLNEPDRSLRRSFRSNKDVPSPRYGINF